jgi:hypothetical protein
VVAIYQTKFLSSSNQIYSKEKNAQNKEARKESVTEELYYVKRRLSRQRFIVVDKGCNSYTCDINDAKFTREQAEKLVKTSRFSLPLYVHRRTRETKKVIIDSQYVDKSERLWN